MSLIIECILAVHGPITQSHPQTPTPEVSEAEPSSSLMNTRHHGSCAFPKGPGGPTHSVSVVRPTAPIANSASRLRLRNHSLFRFPDTRLLVVVAQVKMNSLGVLLRVLDHLDRLVLDPVFLGAGEGELRVRLGEYLPGLVAHDRKVCRQSKVSSFKSIEDKTGQPLFRLGSSPSWGWGWGRGGRGEEGGGERYHCIAGYNHPTFPTCVLQPSQRPRATAGRRLHLLQPLLRGTSSRQLWLCEISGCDAPACWLTAPWSAGLPRGGHRGESTWLLHVQY